MCELVKFIIAFREQRLRWTTAAYLAHSWRDNVATCNLHELRGINRYIRVSLSERMCMASRTDISALGRVSSIRVAIFEYRVLFPAERGKPRDISSVPLEFVA